GESTYFTSDHAKTARHRLHRFQRCDKLTHPVPGARDDKDIEERVELTDPCRGYPAGERGRDAEGSGLTFQRGFLRPVTDDQGPDRDAALGKQLDGLEQGADTLVRGEGGDRAHGEGGAR